MRDGDQLGFSFIVNKQSKEDSTKKASFAIGFDFPESVELKTFLEHMVRRSFDNDRKLRAKNKAKAKKVVAPVQTQTEESEIW